MTQPFKFGDGIIYKSVKKVKFPVNIIGNRAFVTADVVTCSIPLLFSKKSMKRAQMKLNLEDGVAMVHGKKVKLRCTSSGNYCLPLRGEKEMWKKTEEIMLTLGVDRKEKRRKMEKLHQQFGHPTCKRLVGLLRDAGVKDAVCYECAEEVSDACETCRKYRKTPSKPVVSMNMAHDFNEVVAIDLKEYKKGSVYFLHMVDMATRFSKSCITNSKDPKVIVEKVIETWLGTGLGAPVRFLCDNGGEFANNVFLDMCENMNIHVIHTAAYAPFSNRLCEQNHAVIDEMVTKIISEQPDLSLKVALAWAVNAKNCLQMVGGFSPYQLVYGCNPNLPSILEGDLPALEGTTSSDIIAGHLNASHLARKAFIAAETSEKIRRALRHRVRPTGRVYGNGDKVYFKREEQKEWKGPATVIGQDGKTVVLKYGSNVVRAHETHVQEIPYSFDVNTTDGRKELFDMLRNKREENGKMKEIEAVVNPVDIDNDSDENMLTPVSAHGVRVSGISGIPKIGQKIKCLLTGSDDWQTVTIGSRTGKSTGKYSSWRNIQYEDGHVSALDWDKSVQDWVPIQEEDTQEGTDLIAELEPHEILMACEQPVNHELMDAKKEELDRWKTFCVYEEVPINGQKAVSVRWVITEKENSEGQRKTKARLVARGFEEKGDIQSDSPTVSKEVLRSFLAILSSRQWNVNSIDIKAAFLQSDHFDRDVFLVPPRESGCERHVLWKLKKCVYGLNDVARKWYLTVKAFLLNMFCKQVKTDPAAFYWYAEGELCGIVQMHVDDFLWGGMERFETFVIAQIRNKFQVRNQSNYTF